MIRFSLFSAGFKGDGEDYEGVLVRQQRRPTHRSPNQEDPVSAQPAGGDQDVDTTKLTHTQTHTPLTVIHIITALLSS